jgi:hypothetical protein
MLLKNLLDQDTLFWTSAIAGSGLFAIQFLLSLVGTSEGDDLDENGAMDAAQIKWLSKQALTGFLMMFGWTALACKKEFGLPLPITIILSVIAGLATVAINGLLFKSANHLRSTGTVFDLDKAIGKEAFVYQRISKQGAGKISVSIDQIIHEIDAVALNGEEIESFSSVLIAKKIDDKTLAVTSKVGNA